MSKIKGIAKWKVFGRPGSKAPKMKPLVDVKDLLDASEHRQKIAKGLSFTEAKEQIVKLAKKGRVDEEDVPKNEQDVEKLRKNVQRRPGEPHPNIMANHRRRNGNVWEVALRKKRNAQDPDAEYRKPPRMGRNL